MKTIKKRDDEDPWMTEYLKALADKKRTTFSREGKSLRWVEQDGLLQSRIAKAKEAYYDRELQRIYDAGNRRNLAFSALRNLNCAERPKQWSIMDLDKNAPPGQVLEDTADFFSNVASNHEPIDITNLPTTYDRPMFNLTSEMVAERIKTTKRPSSSVPGDIPPKLLPELVDTMAPVFTDIFNSVGREFRWPTKWKLEYQTVIPKKTSPESLSDTRNLSCTNFISKVLETFVIDSIKSEVEMSELQYGGLKGVGTDNFIIEMWNNILEPLEEKDSAVAVMSLDFSKAFNRLSHRACIEKLAKKNASNQTIRLVTAFLHARTMKIRNGQEFSNPRPVLGGSPQGTKLGNLLFCLTIDDIVEPLDDNPSLEQAFPDEYAPILASTPIRSHPYDDSFCPNPYGLRQKKNVIDDSILVPSLTRQECANNLTWEVGYVDDLNIGETLSTREAEVHITTRKEKRTIRAKGCEEMFEVVEKNGEDVGLVINAAKTQLICFSASSTAEVGCKVNINGKFVHSTEQIKVLGFQFGTRPTARYHIDYLIKKFNKLLWSIYHLRKARMTQEVLRKVYLCMLRPTLEYCSNAFHSMLSREQADRLEGCQRKVLRMIYGYEEEYDKILNDNEIPTLMSRREKLFGKFCHKMAASRRFLTKWLPKKINGGMNLRTEKEYIEFYAKTNRLYNSPLFAMRRFLNESRQ